MKDTLRQYEKAARSCREIFIKKTLDYGTSWRVLRMISILDQLFIKARRIRNLQGKAVRLVKEDIGGEFQAMVNYRIIGLIKLDLNSETIEYLDPVHAGRLYDEKSILVREVMEKKTHDYGEAWREMSQEGFV